MSEILTFKTLNQTLTDKKTDLFVQFPLMTSTGSILKSQSDPDYKWSFEKESVSPLVTDSKAASTSNLPTYPSVSVSLEPSPLEGEFIEQPLPVFEGDTETNRSFYPSKNAVKFETYAIPSPVFFPPDPEPTVPVSKSDVVMTEAYNLMHNGQQEKGLQLYQQEIVNGNIDAILKLAEIYELGKYGIPKNIPNAISLYRMGIERNDELSESNLAFLFTSGEAGPAYISHGIQLLRDGVAKNHPMAMVSLAELYESGDLAPQITRDISYAINLYKQAAMLKDPTAANRLGVKYANGAGVEKDDAEAFKYFKIAADGEVVQAMINIGQFYENGIGTDIDYDLAFDYYADAARKGNTLAINIIAYKYLKGDNCEQNIKSAIDLFRKGIELGSTSSMVHLGRCLKTGIEGIIAQDVAEARRLFTQAFDKGNRDAKGELDSLPPV